MKSALQALGSLDRQCQGNCKAEAMALSSAFRPESACAASDFTRSNYCSGTGTPVVQVDSRQQICVCACDDGGADCQQYQGMQRGSVSQSLVTSTSTPASIVSSTATLPTNQLARATKNASTTEPAAIGLTANHASSRAAAFSGFASTLAQQRRLGSTVGTWTPRYAQNACSMVDACLNACGTVRLSIQYLCSCRIGTCVSSLLCNQHSPFHDVWAVGLYCSHAHRLMTCSGQLLLDEISINEIVYGGTNFLLAC